ncbi:MULTISPECIES: permease-like cell division protein FtsX [Haemophilus]|uniref:permease-like cell division protein FtsX n=1 Tax=Haemophilus TaxID=724 RepID=UPI0008A59FE8|nr:MULTISPECIES: permease-like cell division protein FtsX [Haemophilus]MBS5558404.1 permease-like cell division protein FtsX [Haemophilus parainfluenzae]MBS6684006.1 permease-like cell division protein FtsX [Haemophilus parainfluenzae]OFL95426.1 cell division protein FtsX [Haemophilus sp. HMSC061E01]RDE72821.1 cell division protein FtsX [Haemophilus parainfluenzae]
MTRRIDASFGVQTAYTLRSVLGDLVKRKFGTLLTILVIAVSLTIPTVSYLLWKNLHLATTQFYPESELTIYLHKNLSEEDANLVVEKIRQQEGVESLNYVSRQESLKEFKSWSGFGEELEILDDNPLPAVVMVKPSKDFNASEKRAELRTNLNKIKGVQEVRLDNDWMEKLTALSWLFAHVAIFCTVLMTIAVFLVIGNSIRSDVYSSRASIDVMKLLGATDQFILRPYLYTGMIYAVLGGLVAALFSSLIVGYFTSAVKYVTDIFAVTFELNGLGVGELIFLLVSCLIMGYVGAWIAATRHIAMLDNKL